MYFRFKSNKGRELEFGFEGVICILIMDAITKVLGG